MGGRVPVQTDHGGTEPPKGLLTVLQVDPSLRGWAQTLFLLLCYSSKGTVRVKAWFLESC